MSAFYTYSFEFRTALFWNFGISNIVVTMVSRNMLPGKSAPESNPWEKGPLSKCWKSKTQIFWVIYVSSIASDDTSTVGVWKIPNGEFPPAVFLPYILIIIFNETFLKHSLKSSSEKLFFRSWNKSSGEHLGRRWEDDFLGRRLPDNVFWNKFFPGSFPV